ncbi:MAG: hypothetical protein HZC55_20285 [Verrucomicrobia bacterium]|nr:hypothetical protein [Verrucomicrobiota bacterium]
MSDSPSRDRPRLSPVAPLALVAGVVVAALAWLLPVNLKSVSPALLRAAGANTPTLGAHGRDLVDGERIGPAALVLAAARVVDDPRVPALAEAVARFAEQQPGLMAWGGWDPALDNLFNLRATAGRSGSTPVLTFLVTVKAREAMRSALSQSGSDGVQALLKLRRLERTGQFVPAARPGGQPLDSLLLLTGLLYQGQHLSPALQREIRALAEAAWQQQELGPLEGVLIDLLSLGRRLDWMQLTQLTRRSDSGKTLGEYAHLARVAPAQLPLIYAAALFSDSADQVATYLIKFGKAGLEDLTTALGLGQGAVRLLLARGVPINRRTTPVITGTAELVLAHPQVTVLLKYFGCLFGVWLVLRGLDRWLVLPGGLVELTATQGHIRAGLLATVFAFILVAAGEPMLLRAAPPSEFRLRLPVLLATGDVLPKSSEPTHAMNDTSTLLSIGLFAALQVAMYFICLLKIRDVARQPVPPLVKLKLMENEENLFDGGLYVGIAGTATALVLQVMRVIEPNLLAAYASNLFGIICVALVKIYHVRSFKRQLILEAQAEGRIAS